MAESETKVDERDVLEVRQEKLAELRAQGFDFPNDFRRQDSAAALAHLYADASAERLSETPVQVVIAGRMMLRRLMGKASFCQIQDQSGRIQVYCRESELSNYDAFKHWDLGDILGVQGYLFITKTGELTVHATEMVLLTKSLRPMPDKFHGLADQEIRYRQRYLDLIANDETKALFLLRSKLIKTMREFMDGHDFLEVETPMMHPIPGGAVARPFETYHNALDRPMFLRIAPELYLKRLVVGGFERVYEINRNFRNEGLSTRHNPEFTMIEFYQAYADYHDLMDFTEQLFQFLCDKLLQTRTLDYQGQQIDFNQPFKRMTIKEAVLTYYPQLTASDLDNPLACRALLDELKLPYKDSDNLGQLQMIIFEETIEHQLIQPTFVTAYPREVSPLARASKADPSVTDRFELFIMGRELANGFSELNDAQDQAERFHRQVQEKDAGDLEAMHFDHDYIEALEYGLPPTAGEGIGIDRLVMLFTNAASIRDVILFPHLRSV